MIDIKFFENIPSETLEFIGKLNKNKNLDITPTEKDYTKMGKKINMGYICYSLKILKMTNGWLTLTQEEKDKWTDALYNYQTSEYKNFGNYYIDPEVYSYFNKKLSTFSIKSQLKKTANYVLKKNFEEKSKHIFKTLNADNKQTISTLNDLGYQTNNPPKITFESHLNLANYLDSYDWSQPWNAGAQFSSLALYNTVFKLGFENELEIFIQKKINIETGSYFDKKPNNSRQIINGAMKVITGLDWMNVPIHNPEKLIDFCLNNKPEFEGCDLVDYVYVLCKTTNQTNYRKKEVSSLLVEVLEYLKLLYHMDHKGFSYFINKSQTHYYGININKGSNVPDLHGTILSVWAIVMILEVLEKNNNNYKVIKP